jgi:hypothetical protein
MTIFPMSALLAWRYQFSDTDNASTRKWAAADRSIRNSAEFVRRQGDQGQGDVSVDLLDAGYLTSRPVTSALGGLCGNGVS